jgi:hypothetical protein
MNRRALPEVQWGLTTETRRGCRKASIPSSTKRVGAISNGWAREFEDPIAPSLSAPPCPAVQRDYRGSHSATTAATAGVDWTEVINFNKGVC